MREPTLTILTSGISALDDLMQDFWLETANN